MKNNRRLLEDREGVVQLDMSLIAEIFATLSVQFQPLLKQVILFLVG